MNDTPPKAHKIRRPFVYVPAVSTDITQSPAWLRAVVVANLAAVPAVHTFPTKPKE